MNDGCDPQMNEYEMYIAQILAEQDSLKAHAVEVLAKALQNRYISMISLGCKTEKDLSMETMRAEARALLGWDNDNNDKEK